MLSNWTNRFLIWYISFTFCFYTQLLTDRTMETADDSHKETDTSLRNPDMPLLVLFPISLGHFFEHFVRTVQIVLRPVILFSNQRYVSKGEYFDWTKSTRVTAGSITLSSANTFWRIVHFFLFPISFELRNFDFDIYSFKVFNLLCSSFSICCHETR